MSFQAPLGFDWESVKAPLLRSMSHKLLLGSNSESSRTTSTRVSQKELICRRDEFSFASTYWRFFLGAMVVIDFAFTMFHIAQQQQEQPEGTTCAAQDESTSTCGSSTTWWFSFRVPAVVALSISILFSLLCFMDAYLKARWKRDEQLYEMDQETVLYAGSWKHKNPTNRGRRACWGAYYLTMTVQVLLLPVGFVGLIGYYMYADYGDGGVVGKRPFLSSDYFHEYASHSLLRVILEAISNLTKKLIGEEILLQRKLLIRRLLKTAIRRPIMFIRRSRIFLRALRLVKNVGPLMGMLIKWISNLEDLRKVILQHVSCYFAYQKRRREWKDMNPTLKRQLAAIRIQSSFRGEQTRKGVKSFMSVLKARKSMVASRNKHKIVATTRAQDEDQIILTQIDLKKLELRRLREEERDARRRGSNMCIDHRRSMYRLEEEIQEAANHLLNKRLLLRPNSRFAVIWKLVFVVCIFVDIAHQSDQQFEHVPTSNKKSLSADRPRLFDDSQYNILHKLVPHHPTSEWEICTPTGGMEKTKKAPPFWDFFSRKNKRSDHQQQRKERTIPWYCSEWFVSYQYACIDLLNQLAIHLMELVEFVCYADVIVTFFIGEVYQGNLVPKSFVTRWLFPGLLLELLANPQMETTMSFLLFCRDKILQVGPVRLYRWIVVGFYPLMKVFLKFVQLEVFQPAVQHQNENVIDDVSANRMLSTLHLNMSQGTILGSVKRRSIYQETPILI